MTKRSRSRQRRQRVEYAMIILIAIVISIATSAVSSLFLLAEIDRQIDAAEARELILTGENPDALITSIVRNSEDAIVHVQASGTRIVSTLFSQQTVPFSASGSGFVFSEDGYVLTNNHVVEDADSITVIFKDGTERDATLVGRDPLTDVAVLEIPGPAPSLPLGDSDRLLVGQTAIAIGNPLGLDNTVTVGVISGLDRELETADQFLLTGVIQTDAAINPGNSGGPLLSAEGEVIGITSAKLSGLLPSGAVPEGLGFAIPINTAKKIADEIIEKGRVVRPGLGITVVDLTPETVESLAISTTEGVLLVDIVPGGPAEQAGLRGTKGTPDTPGFVLGDIITGIDGKQVSTIQSLRNILFDLKVGQEIEVMYIRNGVERATTLVLGELMN